MIDGPTLEPFPHLIRNGLFEDRLLRRAAEEFPAPDWMLWQRFNDEHERKLSCSNPPGDHVHEVMRLLGGEWMRDFLSEKFGIPGLIPIAQGGGMHMIEPGGFLGIHTDFNELGGPLYRRLNALLFLNDPWPIGWGGSLELWDAERCRVHIRPLLNRLVVFETSHRSYHGHPLPLRAPECRKSIACYFFTYEPPEHYDHQQGTLWL